MGDIGQARVALLVARRRAPFIPSEVSAVAYTQSHIDALKEAIATGALEIEFGTGTERRRIKYRSLAEMRSVLADMLAEVAPASAPARISFIQHSRD
jgi:hypothetical protein